MVNFSMMTFLFFIVLPIGLCVLEIFLSRMDNKYIGLILPAITFIYSLIALLSFAIFDGATTGEIAGLNIRGCGPLSTPGFFDRLK